MSNFIRYFQKILFMLSSPPFYAAYISQPKVGDPTPQHILQNPKWYPYFKDAIGALDGSHIPCCPSAADQVSARNRKGWNSQNTLAAANWTTQFQLMISGYDGSEADSAMYEKARMASFRIP
jgi:hypothetical protein